MKCFYSTILAGIAGIALSPAVLSAQGALNSPGDAGARTELKWTELNGKRTQVFIDLHAKKQATYHGITDGFAPSLMVQLSGDGTAELLQYEGSGDDWKWVPLAAHMTLGHPVPGTDRVEFDRSVLAEGKKFTVVFRSLNEGWTPIASSKVLPWTPGSLRP